MSVKSEFETFSYAGGVARCKTQSIVECRLSGVGEMGNVLAVRAFVAPLSAEAADGEVKYGGKAIFTVVYEDAEKNVCRMERGAEFSHHAADERVTPACAVRVSLRALSASLRREGASMYASCVVEAEIDVHGALTLEYLTGGENLICRKDLQPIYREEYCGGDLEVSDEFETDYVGDVLMHGESALVERVRAEAGSLTVSGEVTVNICALKKEGLSNYERLLPFKAELPCDAASEGMYCNASVYVRSASVSVASDEDAGKSRITLSVLLSVSGMVSIKEEISAVVDAFSPVNNIALARERRTSCYRADGNYFTERVSGVAALSAPIDYSCNLQALVLQRVEAAFAENSEIQGVVSAALLVTESDGAHRSVEVQLPFALPFSAQSDGRREVNALVCGMSVRQKREGEAEIEATLKFAVNTYKEEETVYVSALQTGAEIKPSDCAFSVFLPREGDSLWDIAKTLRKTPEEVAGDNPDLTYPVAKGQRIIVYRQRK